MAALNEYGAIRDEVKKSALELARLAQSRAGDASTDLPDPRQRLDALKAEQARLLDQILENMDDPDLNARLKALAEEKQALLEQVQALEQDEARQALQASRRQEMEEWLKEQPLCFTEYDDTITRRFVEKITVEDAETIRVKIRDADVVLEQKLGR